MVRPSASFLTRISPSALSWVRLACEIALVLILAYLAARIAWLLIAPGPAVSTLTPRPLPMPERQVSQASVSADLSLLMTMNPFETSGEAGEAAPDAPETQLNLKLVALFMSTGDAGGSATIITPNNEATRYELGDDILPGVRLERILSDRVIIARDGQEETLMRSGRDAGLSVIGDPSTSPAQAGRVSTEVPPEFTPGVTAATLLASLDVTAGEADGQTRLTLSPRGDPGLMQAAGLQPGDRLVEIDGTNVSRLDTPALASQLAGARSVRLTVLRAGQPVTFDILFEEG